MRAFGADGFSIRCAMEEDLLISSLAPERALDQVRAAIWHDDAPEDGWFWHHRLVWFDGSEPFDPWDSLLLSVPGGFRAHWRRHDERDRPAHTASANPYGPHADDKAAYDKALHRVTAAFRIG